MSDKLDMQSPDLVAANIDKIASLFPNCVTETASGKAVDFDLLKQELNTQVVEGTKERYRLEWPGKRQAIVTANLPTNKTLRPIREDSVDFDTTENLYIEGDNLEVLKLLQESYLNKIKMIYIDPPYNTGKDFVYKDNFTQDSEEYKEESGLTDDIKNRLVQNPDTSGRYHSDWLSMMYPRLKLARNLMTEDGVIFVSIGVEEFSNLKKVMDEIFGEDNFIEIFSWVKTSTAPALSTKSRKTNEYILCYEKSWNQIKYNGELLDGGDQPLLNSGNSVRILKFPKDKVQFTSNNFKDGIYNAYKLDKVALLDEIEIKNGYALNDFSLQGEFKWTQEFLEEEIKNGTTFIIKSNLLSIRFIRNGEGYKRPTNFIKEKYTSPIINKKDNEVGTNDNASSELRSVMHNDVFSYPKPISLMNYLMNFILKENDMVLDFFSGSGTTADAVMNFSNSNRIKVNFIMVQLAESLIENFKTADNNSKKIIENGISFLTEIQKPLYITELAKERIRRAGKKIKESLNQDSQDLKIKQDAAAKKDKEKGIVNIFESKDSLSDNQENPEDSVNPDSDNKLDVGFRVYRLADSNMKDVYYRPQDFAQETLDLFEDNIKPDRTADDLLTQVMLDWGLPLSLRIEQLTIANKQVFKVAENSLFACFDSNIDGAFAKQLASYKPMRVVFKDRSFKDNSAKENVKQLLKQLSPETDMKVI
jgi:adenine-specific DNA-methyltransferase